MKISEERHNIVSKESSVLEKDAYTSEKPELNLKRPTHLQEAPPPGASRRWDSQLLEYGTSVARWPRMTAA